MSDTIQIDYKVISDIIEPGSKVLDLGCGTGELMEYLVKNKNAKVQGIELNEDAIYKCVARGLSVLHSDIESGLSGYPDKSFDYVVLNQSIQQIKRIDYVLNESFRVAGKVIIGFPNFAHYRARFMLFFRGMSPKTISLPYGWHDTPNIRFLSIKDFQVYCKQKGITILGAYYLTAKKIFRFFPNLFAYNVVFVISKD